MSNFACACRAGGRRRHWIPAATVLALLCLARLPAQQSAEKRPALAREDRDRAHIMLQGVYNDIKDYYYDTTFHGIDLAARYKAYREKLDAATTLGSSLRVVAAFASGLHDSHTLFLPPARSYSFYYGFQLSMIGDRCFVTEVRPATDAATKLHPGEEVRRVNGYTVNRNDFFDLMYDLNGLEPRSEIHFTLVDESGRQQEATVMTKYVTHAQVMLGLAPWYYQGLWESEQDRLARQRSFTSGDVFIWRLRTFVIDADELDKMYEQAKTSPAIVLDLRGNGGGEEKSETELLHFFVKHNTHMYDRVGLHGRHEVSVDPQHTPYPGKLVVLMDSGSASASEIFARIVQLEHLGTVVGDRSAGMVMEASVFGHEMGSSIVSSYADEITVNDLIMSDGHSLEKVGVTPDVVALPTAMDMAAGRDMVLAQAVRLAGGNADASELRKAFPFPWEPYASSH